MLTALFSVTFTSCIDNEVSPVVEAIYEAQADLIAAQAGVQNAEAAYLLAQANAENAQAALIAANAAQVEVQTAGMAENNAYQAAQHEQYLLTLVAQTNLNVATAENALALAQVAFETQLAAAIAAMEAAGAQLAVGYAYNYMWAMNHANDIMSDLLSARANLASAELMQTVNENDDTVSWAFALAQLQGAVASNLAKKADLITAIAAMEAYIANPSTPEAIISGLKAQNIAYHEAMEAKEIEMQVQYNKIMAIYNQNGVRDVLDGRVAEALEDHNDAVEDKNDRLEWIADAQEDVDDLSAALATYAADLTAATNAVTTSTTDYNNAWTALGEKDSQGNSLKTANNSLFGTYFTYSGKTSGPEAIGASATKYAAPANLQQVYVNARIDKLKAEADLQAYQNDFDALVATYNAAAAELAVQQNAFDTSSYAGDLATANTNYNTALTARNNAQTAYAAAKTAFELAPAGSVVTDGPGLISATETYFGTVQFDLGNKGIEDLIATTYMQVTSWRETTFGSNQYIPATFAATKYTPATLATKVTALIADAAYNISTNDDIYIWNDLAGTMPFDDYDGGSVNASADARFLGPTVPAMTQLALPTAAVFVEVESDDSAVPTLWTFNVATNKLGTNSFSDRPFTTDEVGDITYPTWEIALTPSDTDAGYDSAWDGSGVMGAADTLTAQAALWNMGLELAKKQYAFDNGSVALDNAQAAFDYQKELFDNGVANLADLTDDVTAATTAQTAAKKAVDNAWTTLGYEYVAGVSADSPKWWVAKTGFVVDATAGYDADFTAPLVKNTLTVNAVVFNAEVAKAKLAACNAVCIQGQIDSLNTNIANWTQQIAAIQPIIDAKYAVIAGLLVELTDAGIEYTFEVDEDGFGILEITNYGFLSSLYPDLHAAIIAEWQVYWSMEQELDALENAHDLNADLISAYGWSSDDLNDLAEYLGDLKDDLNDAIYDIEVAEQALASGQADQAVDLAYIAYLEALVNTLEQRHANTLAIAAKYKALMDAALAS